MCADAFFLSVCKATKCWQRKANLVKDTSYTSPMSHVKFVFFSFFVRVHVSCSVSKTSDNKLWFCQRITTLHRMYTLVFVDYFKLLEKLAHTIFWNLHYVDNIKGLCKFLLMLPLQSSKHPRLIFYFIPLNWRELLNLHEMSSMWNTFCFGATTFDILKVHFGLQINIQLIKNTKDYVELKHAYIYRQWHFW